MKAVCSAAVVAFIAYALSGGVGGDPQPGFPQYTEEENKENVVYTYTPCDCKQIQNPHENLEEILDRKLEPLRKIILGLQDDVTAKLETIASSQNNVIRKVDEFTDNTVLELSTNIIKKINSKIDSASQECETLKSTEKINHRLVVLENDLQINVITKLDNITALQNKQNRYIREIAENVLLEQTTNITRQINDNINAVFKDKESFASSDKLNLELISLDNKMKRIENNTNNIATKRDLLTANNNYHLNNTAEQAELESLQQINTNISDDMQTAGAQINQQLQISRKNEATSEICELTKKLIELIDHVINGQMTNISTEIANHLKSVPSNGDILESIQQVKQKLDVLDKFSNLEQQMKKLVNISEQQHTNTISTSVNKYEQEQKANNEISESKSDRNNFTSLCNATRLSSAHVMEDIKKWKKKPEIDDLDILIVNKTGCQYAGVGYGENVTMRHPVSACQCGAPRGAAWFEWVGAARATAFVSVYVVLNERSGYVFRVAENNDTFMMEWWSGRKLEERPTPPVLSRGRYVPVVVRIQDGCLTFGLGGCEPHYQPLFTRCGVEVVPGDEVLIVLESWLHVGGAKFLHHCPAA